MAPTQENRDQGVMFCLQGLCLALRTGKGQRLAPGKQFQGFLLYDLYDSGPQPPRGQQDRLYFYVMWIYMLMSLQVTAYLFSIIFHWGWAGSFLC